MDIKEVYLKLSMLCSRKEYCISDVEKKLDIWKIGEEKQGQIIKDLIAEKFIDETRFVEAFVKDKFRFNRWGRNKIRYHLKQKRISDNLINKALDSIQEIDYQKVVKELLITKNRNLKAKDNYERKTKLIRFMVQRGFEYDALNNEIDDLFCAAE